MTQIINFVKGIIIGIAVVIPGLSGSIFAVVVGLYDKMINAISGFRKNIKKIFFSYCRSFLAQSLAFYYPQN